MLRGFVRALADQTEESSLGRPARRRRVFALLQSINGGEIAISQKEVAALLGVDAATVWRWKNQKSVQKDIENFKAEFSARFAPQVVTWTLDRIKRLGPEAARVIFREIAGYRADLRAEVFFRFQIERDQDLLKPTPEKEALWAEVDALLTWVKSNSVGPHATPEAKVKWEAWERRAAIENRCSEALGHLVRLWESGKIERGDFIAARDHLEAVAGLAREAVYDAEKWHVKFVNKGKWGKNAK
ncbi:MAG: hypothetical protein JRH05_01910 [Deltaproteobacteria bacterium]|nr:hypothetical protein [Deltaproteobacteria bacterium]